MAGQPAAISTHRCNYKAFDLAGVERNFRCLRELLAAIAVGHPDAIYLCGDEVAQLELQGYSIATRGDRIICRNYSETALPVSVEVAGEVLSVTLPRGELLIRSDEP